MKAYKGFDKNMRCMDFQYEEGKTYELPEGQKASLCESGFHACEDPLDCFRYYPPASSLYHGVDLDATEERATEDSKCVGKRVTIGAALNVKGLIEAHVKYVKERITNERNAEPGKPATAGDSGAATAGRYGAATAGRYGAATAGSYGAATAGDRGAATAGDSGAATAGRYGAATAGDSGAATAGRYGAATAGDSGAATSRGKASVGKYGIACARGNGCMVKGDMGAVLLIGEEADDSYELVTWKAVVVDGETIKPDVWYRLVNGVFVEA